MYYRFSPHPNFDVEGCHMKRFRIGEVIEAAKHPLDSLMDIGFFVHGCILNIVDLEDISLGPTKVVTGRCTGIRKTCNVTTMLHEFSYWCGRQMAKDRDVPDVIRKALDDSQSYLDGDGIMSLRWSVILAARPLGLYAPWIENGKCAHDGARNTVKEARRADSLHRRPQSEWAISMEDKFQAMVDNAFGMC
jgi:hypothetical protein